MIPLHILINLHIKGVDPHLNFRIVGRRKTQIEIFKACTTMNQKQVICFMGKQITIRPHCP